MGKVSFPAILAVATVSLAALGWVGWPIGVAGVLAYSIIKVFDLIGAERRLLSDFRSELDLWRKQRDHLRVVIRDMAIKVLHTDPFGADK